MNHRKTFIALRNVTLCLALSVALAPGQSNTVTTVSGAGYNAVVAPDSIVSGWGTGFSTTTVSANTSSTNGQPVTLPTTLGNVTLTLKDKNGGTSTQGLYMVSPGQINYVIPAGAALGNATLTVQRPGATTQTGNVQISNVAPALYTADASGLGVPVGSVLRVNSAQTVTLDNTYQSGTATYTPKPISLAGTDNVFLVLYGTGIRNRSLNPVKAMIGTAVVAVPYAGAQSTYPGFDQINIGPLPASLVGKGNVDLTLFVDGVPSNTVKLAIQ